MPVLREGHTAEGQPTNALTSLQLGTQEQSQGLQHSPAWLQEQLGATQAQEQQSLQQLSRAKEAIQGLHRKVVELQQQVRARQDRTEMQPQCQTPLQERLSHGQPRSLPHSFAGRCRTWTTSRQSWPKPGKRAPSRQKRLQPTRHTGSSFIES